MVETMMVEKIDVEEFKDSTSLIGDPQALRKRWDEDGCLYLRNIIDPKLMKWAEGFYRDELAKEGLIDLANDAPILISELSNTWRPCDRIGTTVWHEVIKQPKLLEVLRILFEGHEPAWLPIVAHRSGYPNGPMKDGEYLFAGQHQDAFYNEGMHSTICWMPVRDIPDQNHGTFAVAPGTHKRGVMHDPSLPRNKIPDGAIDPDEWRTAAFRVGDVVIFRDDTAHAALPNLSNEIRLSMDLRVGSSAADQPVSGTVEALDGTAVTIKDDFSGASVTVHVNDNTYIRDMNPQPRIPTHEVEKIAFVGARVLAMTGADRVAKVLRRNRY